MNNKLSLTEVSNSLGVSKAIVKGWEKSGKLIPELINNEPFYNTEDLLKFDVFKELNNSQWESELKIKPTIPYSSIVCAYIKGLPHD